MEQHNKELRKFSAKLLIYGEFKCLQKGHVQMLGEWSNFSDPVLCWKCQSHRFIKGTLNLEMNDNIGKLVYGLLLFV